MWFLHIKCMSRLLWLVWICTWPSWTLTDIVPMGVILSEYQNYIQVLECSYRNTIGKYHGNIDVWGNHSSLSSIIVSLPWLIWIFKDFILCSKSGEINIINTGTIINKQVTPIRFSTKEVKPYFLDSDTMKTNNPAIANQNIMITEK